MMGKKKVYIAYGSNLNMTQMEHRCPLAEFLGVGYLNDWELIYRGSKTGSYATIRPKPGNVVPVGLWNITRFDEKQLDIYEGFPSFYQKHNLSVEFETGEQIIGMAYIMDPNRKVGRPSEYYIDTVYQGYMDCGLDARFLLESLITNRKEMKKGRG